MKSFKHWKRQEVEEIFGLNRLQKMPLLEEWKKVNINEINESEKSQIEELREFIAYHVMDWNEAELKFHFLGPFMRVVNFYSDKYSPFVERSLSVDIGGKTANGNIDFMVATGSQIPRAPYFCLHEYKPEEGSSNDASGQLLIAMVAAQQANQKTRKICLFMDVLLLVETFISWYYTKSNMLSQMFILLLNKIFLKFLLC